MSDFYRPSAPPFGLDLTKIYLDAQAADFEGYSPVAAVTLRFSKDVNFDSLLGAVRLFNLTAESEVGNTFAFTAQRTKWSCENRLSVQPFIDQPMVAGDTYAVVVTTAVRSAGDETPVQDPDLAAVLGRDPPHRRVARQGVGHLRGAAGPARRRRRHRRHRGGVHRGRRPRPHEQGRGRRRPTKGSRRCPR